MGSYEAVKQAILTRITWSDKGADLLAKHGPERVMEEIENQAQMFESYRLDEIGTSDVSCWVSNIERNLEKSNG